MEKQITDSLERYKEIAKKVRLKNHELEVLSELAHSVENMRNNYVSKKGKYEFSRGMNEVNGIIIIPQLDKALEEFRELRVQLDEEEKRFKNIAKFHGFNLDTNIINLRRWSK
jgi:vacuolar-type H+-ATPase subunit I/STV1